MRCNQCQYPLWNLKTRNCPECGVSFAPSDYQFLANGVRFCCPHCDQEYYGTSERGHLVPSAFECVHCRAPVTMDEMVLRPVHGQEDTTYAVIEPVPWLQRRHANWFQCWWKTIWRGMISPVQLMRGLPVEAQAGEAWLFAFLTLLATFIVGGGLPFGIFALIEAANGGSDALELMIAAVAISGGALLFALLCLVLWGLTTHGTLLLTGGCERGLAHTFQPLCYSVGPAIFMAVPCLGMYCFGYVSVVWWIVSAILMIMTYQGVQGGRAALAALVFPVLAIVAAGVLYFGLIFGGIMLGGMGAGAFNAQQQFAMTQTEAQSMAIGMQVYKTTHGAWPVHAAQLIDEQIIMPASYFASTTLTYSDTTPLADSTMEEFEFADKRRQNEMISAAVAAQPNNVIAHRLGDYVFTYHGFDQQFPHSGLWIFVNIEDPDSNDFSNIVDPVFICRADFVVESIARADLPGAIERQNELRESYRLAPLPTDLLDVTHDNPTTNP